MRYTGQKWMEISNALAEKGEGGNTAYWDAADVIDTKLDGTALDEETEVLPEDFEDPDHYDLVSDVAKEL